MRARLTLLAVLAGALALPGAAWANHGTYKLTYFSNAHNDYAPDAQVRIINPGEAVFEDTVSVPSDLCAMIYVFRPDQQLEECCGCKLTPNALLTLSVNDDLTSNPLHGGTLTTGVIKIVSTFPTLTDPPANSGSSRGCNPADLAWIPTRELRSWGTHIQNAGAGSFQITETAFEGNDHSTMLSSEEEVRLKTLCAIIMTGLIEPVIPPQGSGQGVCRCPGEGTPPAGVDPPIVGTVPAPAPPPAAPPAPAPPVLPALPGLP
jgi:hypothetical protein